MPPFPPDPSDHDTLAFRFAGPGDRPALLRLGYAPAVAALFAAGAGRRLVWRLEGTRSRAVVAVLPSGELAGGVHFVRTRRDPDTWMFGHWRVAAARRRRGIGGAILRGGTALLEDVRRLYSYVDLGNDASEIAHRRLGFESGATLHGLAQLGGLSTLGPPSPALRVDEVAPADWGALTGIYARAMGSLWLRLFPATCGGIPPFATDGLAWPAVVMVLRPVRVLAVRTPGGARAGFAVWSGSRLTLYVDPAVCDAGFLARAAQQLVALGAGRGQDMVLRGLPSRDLAARAGSIAAQILMGMPDVATCRERPTMSSADERRGPGDRRDR